MEDLKVTNRQNISVFEKFFFLAFLDSALMELAGGRGWVVAGETVHIRKQEELIKPKKILAKIDMESEYS